MLILNCQLIKIVSLNQIWTFPFRCVDRQTPTLSFTLCVFRSGCSIWQIHSQITFVSLVSHERWTEQVFHILMPLEICDEHEIHSISIKDIHINNITKPQHIPLNWWIYVDLVWYHSISAHQFGFRLCVCVYFFSHMKIRQERFHSIRKKID